MREDLAQSVVLIVEDSGSTRMAARASIDALGLGVREAANGAEALAIFESESISLVLLDVGLPDISGFEVAERIRGTAHGADVPIIMLTGNRDPESIRRSFAVGATDFAPKPVSWVVLGQRILFVLDASSKQKKIVAQRTELEDTQRMARIGAWTYRANSGQIEMSDAAREIFDVPPLLDIVDVVNERIPESEIERLQMVVTEAIEAERAVEVKHRWLDAHGNERVMYTHARGVDSRDSIGFHVRGHSQDITTREEAQNRVLYLNEHDELTGLKKESVFRDHLEMMFAQQRRIGSRHALLIVNLDNFGRINDMHGRDVGDAILRATSERLTLAIRETDLAMAGLLADTVIARVGADEFSIALGDLKQPADAARVAARVLAEIHEPVEYRGRKYAVTGRIGAAIAPEDGTDLKTLLVNAQAANRHARDVGGNTYDFYRSSMNEVVQERLRLEDDFRAALANDELQVWYQPRVDMKSAVVVGAEALSRWEHGRGEWVSPEVFVQIAEEAGLTFEFGESVVRKSLEQTDARMEGARLRDRVDLDQHLAHLARRFPPSRANARANRGKRRGSRSRRDRNHRDYADPA